MITQQELMSHLETVEDACVEIGSAAYFTDSAQEKERLYELDARLRALQWSLQDELTELESKRVASV